MKKVILGMSLVFLIIIAISIVLTLDGRQIRTNEVRKSLASAIDDSVENMMSEKHYSITDNNELISDLLQSLLLHIESTSTVTVNVLDIDYEKGILSIEVTESFKHPNGNTGTVSTAKTVIFEKDTSSSGSGATETVKITYLLPGNVIYKEFSVKKDSEVIIPQNPSIEGKTFKQWTLNGSKYALTDANNRRVKATENISLMAEFE